MSKFRRSSVHSDRIDGIPVTVPNLTDEVDTGSPHWYISYNSHDRRIYGGVTTALVLGQMEVFLVLQGDHRKQFQELINNEQPLGTTKLERCLNYVRSNPDQIHPYSQNIFAGTPEPKPVRFPFPRD